MRPWAGFSKLSPFDRTAWRGGMVFLGSRRAPPLSRDHREGFEDDAIQRRHQGGSSHEVDHLRRARRALVSTSAFAQAPAYEIMAPASPGGGWDQTARAMQNVLQETKLASNVQVVNVPGAGGTIGSRAVRLDEVRQPERAARRRLRDGRRDPHQQVAGHARPGDAARPPHRRGRGHRGSGVLALPDDRRPREGDEGEPGRRGDRRRLCGGTDHIAAGLLAQAVGADPKAINYIAFSGGGEALAAILGQQVAAGISATASSRAR